MLIDKILVISGSRILSLVIVLPLGHNVRATDNYRQMVATKSSALGEAIAIDKLASS